MRPITRDEVCRLLDHRAVTLVEALPQPQYEAEHLPGAANVPGQLDPDTAASIAPDPAGTIVVYCSGPACGRSTSTAFEFSQLGYTDVYVYRGGKADWAGAGLPLHGARHPNDRDADLTATKETP